MPSPTLKIDNARYIFTMGPERRIIKDGSIVTDGQRITHVGKATELEGVQADQVIDASEMVVTPGFYNGHMHISYPHATRGIFPGITPSDVSIYLATVFQLQTAMTEEEEYYTSLMAITELLKGGTTCFVDPGSTKYPDACMQAYEDSGCRIILGAHVADKPNPVNVPVYETVEAISVMEKTIKEHDHRLNDRVRAWAMPFDGGGMCSTELLVAAKRLADEYGTGLGFHHSSNPRNRKTSMEEYGKLPTEYLEEIGVLGPNVLLAHVGGLEDAEIDSIARTHSNVAVCPKIVLRGMEQYKAKLPEMLEKGINVSLGSDSGTLIYLDALDNMNLATMTFSNTISAEKALEMGTLLGAKALGFGDDLGSIEVGKKADMVLFDTQRLEWQGLFNPINNLVYIADSRSVHTVIVDGRMVVEAYQAPFVDERSLAQKVQEIGENMLARTGVSLPYPQQWPIV